jgi:iron complex outermembrane receptor protein
VQQKFYSSVSTNLNAAGVLTETLTAREGSAVTKAFGIAPLKEETSKSASVGIVLRPASNFSLTADLYRINIDDRIVFSSEHRTGIGRLRRRRLPDRPSSIR